MLCAQPFSPPLVPAWGAGGADSRGENGLIPWAQFLSPLVVPLVLDPSPGGTDGGATGAAGCVGWVRGDSNGMAGRERATREGLKPLAHVPRRSAAFLPSFPQALSRSTGFFPLFTQFTKRSSGFLPVPWSFSG